MPKLITILGPTASGKSALGIELAQEFGGEIVSADSRQVYRGLNIGTGKVTAAEQALAPHHLLDVVEPPTPSRIKARPASLDSARDRLDAGYGTGSTPPRRHPKNSSPASSAGSSVFGDPGAGGDILFSVANYQRHAFEAIEGIIKRGRRPFLVGGTALYIYAVIDNYRFMSSGPNLELRRELEQKTAPELQNILYSVIARERSDRSNPDIIRVGDGIASSARRIDGLPRNDIINPYDFRNKRRLIRAIEKLEAGGTLAPKKGPAKYDNIILGIDIPRPELYERIDRRVDERVKQGMIDEVVKLRQKSPPRRGGVRGGAKMDDWLLGLGLEYRFITEYLQGKWPSQEAMLARLKTSIHAFARRQLTWWRKDKRIAWIKDKKEAARFIKSRL